MSGAQLIQELTSLFAPQKWRRRSDLFMTVLIVIAVGFVYFPAVRGGFVLDDDLLLTHNSIVQSPDGLARFWWPWNAAIADRPADYWPVSNSSLWLEWRLWGMNPTGYHVTNLLLHIAGSLLLWLVLRKLAIPGAWFAALLFATHPVNVESVAWIAQRKNLLALFFSLLSVWCWLKAEDRQTSGTNKNIGFEKFYTLSLLAFVAAMLSKGSIAILPIVLLLIAWWQRRQIRWIDVSRTAPFFIMATVLTLVNVQFQSQGAVDAIRDVSFLQRILGAAAAVWFYAAKALAPLNLTLVYPQWNIDPANLRWWLPLLAAVLLTGVLFWKCHSSQAKWARPALFAWLFFCVALLPVLGFIDVGYMRHSLVANHYEHIAMIAVIALIGVAINAGWKRFHRTPQIAIGFVAAVMVVALLILSRQQAALYAGALPLYENAVENNPDSWLARNNLGDSLAQADRPREAIVQFERTLELKSDSALVHNNLAMSLAAVGRSPEAIDHYQQALRLEPKYPDAENNFAMALAIAGRMKEAESHFRYALECQPNFSEAHNNLGSLLLKTGQLEQAVGEFQCALKLKPNYFEARNNLGIVLAKSGLFSDAIAQYEQALWIKPDSAETQNNLGNALAKSGRLFEAIEHYQLALQWKPDYEQAYVDLAMAHSAAGHHDEARSAAETALELARLHNQTVLAAQIDAWLTTHRIGSTIK